MEILSHDYRRIYFERNNSDHNYWWKENFKRYFLFLKTYGLSNQFFFKFLIKKLPMIYKTTNISFYSPIYCYLKKSMEKDFIKKNLKIIESTHNKD